MKKLIQSVVLALVSSGFCLASASAAEPLKVVASFSIVGDFARNVGGDRIELTTLVGPDSDTHLYQPTPAHAAAVAAADVVLANGLGLEGFLAKVLEASGGDAPLVTLSDGVQPLDTGEGRDPHAFQNIANAKIYVGNVLKAFCAADASGCSRYEANAETYLRKLDATQSEVRAAISAIPADRRVIVTSHDAFGYFAEAYGLNFIAPEGISTEAEASAADVASIIRQVRKAKAAAVFLENVTNTALVERISAETGVSVGGTLYSDALSGAGGPAATYIDMMLHNVRTIRGAILGS